MIQQLTKKREEIENNEKILDYDYVRQLPVSLFKSIIGWKKCYIMILYFLQR